MQAFHGLLSTGSIILVVKASPFSKLQRLLLSSSYFLLYEYSIISRSYAMGIFLIFLFCTLYSQHRLSAWVLVIVLSLLANTSLFGLIISLALSLVLCAGLWTGGARSQQKKQVIQSLRWRSSVRKASPKELRESPIAQFWPQLAVLILSWTLSTAQIFRAFLSEFADNTTATVTAQTSYRPNGYP